MAGTDWFTPPTPRAPDPNAALAVDAIRRRVSQLAAAQLEVHVRYERERKVRKICERNWDRTGARSVLAEILAVLDGE